MIPAGQYQEGSEMVVNLSVIRLCTDNHVHKTFLLELKVDQGYEWEPKLSKKATSLQQ